MLFAAKLFEASYHQIIVYIYIWITNHTAAAICHVSPSGDWCYHCNSIPQSTLNTPSGEAGELYLLLASLTPPGLMEMQQTSMVAIYKTASFLKLFFVHNIRS